MQGFEGNKLTEAERFAVNQAIKVFSSSDLTYSKAVKLLPAIEKRLKDMSLAQKIKMEDLRHL